MRRFLDRLYAASGVAAALCLVGIFVVMLAQSFGREGGVFVRGADDIVAWLCAATAFLALGHTFRHGELVRVGLWLDMLGARGRWFAELGLVPDRQRRLQGRELTVVIWSARRAAAGGGADNPENRRSAA